MSGGDCMELALRGEEACRAGRIEEGIESLEAALVERTDNMHTLSAIYSQLGNAYFHLRDYEKALQYHRHDFNLAKWIKDSRGEAKAAGNLGNTLKQLGNYEAAIICATQHLGLSRDLGDVGHEARALYNLGNIYHAKGKALGRSMSARLPGPDDSPSAADFPGDVRAALEAAVEYFEGNLKLVSELGDKAGMGRAYGNLGNTHYLLGQFNRAIQYHQERLKLGKEFGDKAAMRRAYTNLGNAHVFLAKFTEALHYYKKALELAVELGESAQEAQSHYSIGNASTLLEDHDGAVAAHKRHLVLARDLKDPVGEARAASSLAAALAAADRPKHAAYFALLHLHLSQQIGDRNGVDVARASLAELRPKLPDGRADAADSSEDPSPPLPLDRLLRIAAAAEDDGLPRRPSMERIGPYQGEKLEKPGSLNLEAGPSGAVDSKSDDFLTLLMKAQGKRLDDQRCDASTLEDKENRPRRQADGLRPVGGGDSSPEDFLDLIANIQGRRIDDQRAALPFLPGLQDPERVLGGARPSEASGEEDFLDMLVRCQGARIEEQRSELSAPAPAAAAAATVPEEDLFAVIMKAQRRRMDGQRGRLDDDTAVSAPDPAAVSAPDSAFKQPHKRTASQKIKKR